MLKVGDKLPAGSLSEFIEVEGNGCSLGPNSFDHREGHRRQRRLPCSRCRAPSPRPALGRSTCRDMWSRPRRCKAAGVDEDLVRVGQRRLRDGRLGAVTRTPPAKVRMMADGSADFAEATGLTLDLTRARHGPAFAPLLDAGASMAWPDDAQRRRRRASSRSATPARLLKQAKGLSASRPEVLW